MSETSLMRREPRGDWHDTAHVVKVGAMVLGVVALLHSALQASFRWTFFDLQAVTVPDHVAGADPLVSVDRVIRRDWPMTYVVTVRDADTHRWICDAAPPRPINYRRAANAFQPWTGRLSDWLVSEAALEDCVARGFGVGRFYLETCHHALLGGVWPLHRCVESNRFTREPPEMAVERKT